MQNNSGQDGQRRIRNVPIRLEGDGSGNCRYVNNQHLDHGQERMDFDAHPTFGFHHQQPQMHQQFGEPNFNQSNQQAPTHTSSIDINYKPPHSQQDRPQKPPHQIRGATTKGNNDSFNQTNHSSRWSSQAETGGFNKENSESCVDRNKSPPTGDSAIEKNSPESDIQEPKKPEAVIPLPPPPEQPRSESKSSQGGEQEQEQQQKEQTQSEKSESKKVKQESGPQSLINATKVEVNRLLKEIADCNETSLESKEYRRLDELLTRCILKLDSIQSQELKKQRKEVITLIDRCTQLLERKIHLNRDIQQLSANCS